MRFFALAVLPCLFGAVNAHFRLLYPLPRGEFVEDIEPNYCGGYTQVTTNRTTFPISGGFFTIKTGHPGFTVGAILSTVQNPISFDNFSVAGVQQMAAPYVQSAEAGTLCFPLNITAAGIAGATDGANVTVQIVFSGGDGNLYQCADLTLSANLTTPPDATCENITTTTTTTASATGSGSAATASTTTAGTLSLAHGASAVTAVLFAIAGIAASLL